MEKVQVIEFEKAEKFLRNGFRLRFMDVTHLSGYLNDGNAGKYGKKARVSILPFKFGHFSNGSSFIKYISLISVEFTPKAFNGHAVEGHCSEAYASTDEPIPVSTTP
ncbi:uncharacterized protein A4U43_C05F14070 [Asparagus officinalis]|uniref:Uncharacterized protein n=1 Tax=Asparagus officinalis TaxID=4686 RepID=A0A5P1ESJ6_ASPOF|nr:uncharacterized protein A4U43_C05F14070 [Asparagus officinalis]